MSITEQEKRISKVVWVHNKLVNEMSNAWGLMSMGDLCPSPLSQKYTNDCCETTIAMKQGIVIDSPTCQVWFAEQRSFDTKSHKIAEICICAGNKGHLNVELYFIDPCGNGEEIARKQFCDVSKEEAYQIVRTHIMWNKTLAWEQYERTRE